MRWVLLVAILSIALFDPAHHLPAFELGLFTVGFGAYSLVITALLAIGLLVGAVPAFTLTIDTLAFLILVQLSGGVTSPFVLFPLFPILAGTLQFGWQVGLFLAVVFVLNESVSLALVWREQGDSQLIFQTGIHALFFVLIAILGEVASRRPVPSSRVAGGYESPSYVSERVKTVFEIASTLSATLNYQRVLEAILDISRMGFEEVGPRIGESAGMVLLYDENGMLYVASHRNLSFSEDTNLRLKGRSGIVAQAIATGEALIEEEAASDPELNKFRSLKRSKSMLCVPLRAGFETYGVVLFASVRAEAYSTEHLDILSIFCNQATIALQNANLYQSLTEERDKIINKEEEARRKLARDLHDGPTQDVAAIAMRLNFARLLIERDPPRARAELERLEDLAHRTVKEIRSMLFTLRPVILETEGLVAALNQYADNLRENDRQPVEVDAEQYEDCLDTDTQGVVFAIIEEAVNNAKKHAQASKIWIRLRVEGDLFVAQVIDNGIGFELEAIERNYGSRGSLGMINLKERAELIDGTLNIESVPGQGTEITLLVPIVDEPI